MFNYEHDNNCSVFRTIKASFSLPFSPVFCLTLQSKSSSHSLRPVWKCRRGLVSWVLDENTLMIMGQGTEAEQKAAS